MPQFWMIAGPNGAGKSTLTAKYLEGRVEIINPDVIARELDPLDPNGANVRVQAGRMAIARQRVCLEQGLDFSVETTLSGRREVELLSRAREAGFKVNLVYVGIASTNTSAGRVAQRVSQGGHHIPLEDLELRYSRSLANLPNALARADRAYVLDNSGKRYRLLLRVEQGQTKRIARDLPRWTRIALPAQYQRLH